MAGEGLVVGELVGFDRLASALGGSSAVMEAAMVEAMELSTHLVEENARSRAPRKSGRLAASLTSKVEPSILNVEGKVGTTVNYARAVELGTRPHEIVPSSAPVLSFAIGGTQAFAESVQHPGTQGTHFLRDALDSSKVAINGFFRAAGGRLMGHLAGK